MTLRPDLAPLVPALLLPLLAGFGGCGQEPTELSLVWQDEFDGPAGQLPDPARWRFSCIESRCIFRPSP